jgi:hypothetical protein
VDDLEGILYDIDTATGNSASGVDKSAYLNGIRKAEESVIYKSLLFRAVRTTFSGNPNLMFELENTGNIDIDLLFAEIRFPQRILQREAVIMPAQPTLEVDRADNTLLVRYYSIHNSVRPDVRRLEPTITRSMGVRRLRDLRIPLKSDADGLDLSAVIRYQIHGRQVDTDPEERPLAEIPVEPEKCS